MSDENKTREELAASFVCKALHDGSLRELIKFGSVESRRAAQIGGYLKAALNRDPGTNGTTSEEREAARNLLDRLPRGR